ncbi:Ammonium transporter Rh type B-A [Bienertia sinuspersici]
MEANKENVSCNHVMLLPDKSKAKFRNLFKQFCFTRKKVSESELLHHSIPQEEHKSKFLHRGLIFVSVFIQIVLKHLAKPLKIFQHFLEDSLNHGVPQRDSEKYYTLLGFSDYRLDLDKTLKREDSKYYPALLMMACKWNLWTFTIFAMCTTQAFLCQEKNPDGDVIVVAFRGISMFVADDWSTDFDFSWVKIDGMGKGHMGFMMALGINKFSQFDEDYLGNFLWFLA